MSIYQPFCDGLGDVLREECAGEVQDGTHHDGEGRRQDAGRDHGRDGVGCVVEAVRVVKQQGEGNNDD